MFGSGSFSTGFSGDCRLADVRFCPVIVQPGPAPRRCVWPKPCDSSFQTGLESCAANSPAMNGLPPSWRCRGLRCVPVLSGRSGRAAWKTRFRGQVEIEGLRERSSTPSSLRLHPRGRLTDRPTFAKQMSAAILNERYPPNFIQERCQRYRLPHAEDRDADLWQRTISNRCR
jgi:hypothetical protein